MGRARRARHRVRADAPLGRRHRRRRDRELGLPRGRHGRGRRRVCALRRGPSAPRSARTRASSASSSATAAPSASRSTAARSCRAPLVVTAIHPKITFLEQIERSELPDDVRRATSRTGRRARGTVKINLALAELPEFTADPGFDPDIHGGAIQMLDDVDYLEKAFQEARFGQAATLPFSDTAIPTVFDKTLAPEGMHVMSMFTQWVPAGVGRRGRPRGRPRGVRRPADRPRERGRAELQGLDHAPADHRAAGRCRRSGA